MNQGNVYIMHSYSQDAFKIGESNNVEDRLNTGRTWVIDLKVIESYPFFNKKIAQAKESYLHTRFKSKRIDKKKEWFALDSVDLIEVDQYLHGGGKMSIFRRTFLKGRLKILNVRIVLSKIF